MRRTQLWFRCAMLGAGAFLGGCAGARAPLPVARPTPAGADLVRRHFDQVCRIAAGDQPVITVGELFDTVGLASELSRFSGEPRTLDPLTRRARWHSVQFISRYGRDGDLTVAGGWEATVDSATARSVSDILHSRVRRLPGILRAEGFRTVIELAPHPIVTVAPPVVCLPHMTHLAGQRPFGLPTDVTTWYESARFRVRPDRPPPEMTATVRVHLDPDGVVTAVEPLAGDAELVQAARGVVAQLRYDPALRNGEAVVGAVVQTFVFRKPG